MRRVLVTGAAGFIGTRLVSRFAAEGAFVRALVRSTPLPPRPRGRVEEVRGDLRDEAAMRDIAKGVDSVFHLGGKAHALDEPRQDLSEYRAANVEGTRNVLDSATRWGCRSFVYFSSVKAMGEDSPQERDESSRPTPTTAYGRTKLEAEELVLHVTGDAGLRGACLRLPLVYGPGNGGNLFRMMRAIDLGFFPPLPDTGNRRSMLHVDNAVDAALLAADDPAAAGRCFIVTDRRPYSTREVYDGLRGALGLRPASWAVPAPLLRGLGRSGDVLEALCRRRVPFDSAAVGRLLDSAIYSSALIKRELGYEPKLSLSDALAEMAAHYRGARA